MPLTYVSFSYLSKVNLGRKFVHWTLTLSQDSCSLYEPMYPTHLSPLLLSYPYLFIGLGNWVGGDRAGRDDVTTGKLFPSRGECLGLYRCVLVIFKRK